MLSSESFIISDDICSIIISKSLGIGHGLEQLLLQKKTSQLLPVVLYLLCGWYVPTPSLFLINIYTLHGPRRIIVYTTQNAHGVHFDCKFIVCDATSRSRIPCVFQPKCSSSSKMRLGFNVIVNLYVNSSRIPCLFRKKTRLAGILPHSSGSLSLCFSQVNCVLGSQVTVNLYVMRPTPPRLLIFFQGKRASQVGVLRGRCHCKFSLVGRRPSVYKGAL